MDESPPPDANLMEDIFTQKKQFGRAPLHALLPPRAVAAMIVAGAPCPWPGGRPRVVDGGSPPRALCAADVAHQFAHHLPPPAPPGGRRRWPPPPLPVHRRAPAARDRARRARGAGRLAARVGGARHCSLAPRPAAPRPARPPRLGGRG